MHSSHIFRVALAAVFFAALCAGRAAAVIDPPPPEQKTEPPRDRPNFVCTGSIAHGSMCHGPDNWHQQVYIDRNALRWAPVADPWFRWRQPHPIPASKNDEGK